MVTGAGGAVGVAGVAPGSGDVCCGCSAPAGGGCGVVAVCIAIRSAIEEGAPVFDFLHGDEPYKFHWAPSTRRLCRIELFPPGKRGAFLHSLVRLDHTARATARRLLLAVRSSPAVSSLPAVRSSPAPRSSLAPCSLHGVSSLHGVRCSPAT